MIHYFLEGSIIFLKFFAFLFQLLLNILVSNENSFQILPFLLHLHPYLDTLRNQVE